MRILLRIVYMIARIYPMGFLIASAKAMNWNVSVEPLGDNVASITISNPELVEK